jgi:hypothetical protein
MNLGAPMWAIPLMDGRTDGNNIILHGADALVVHRSQDARVVILEYDVHGKIIRTGASYDNRFISRTARLCNGGTTLTR